MLRKHAKVIQGEYQEWQENEGPAQPATQREKLREFRSDLLSVSRGKIETDMKSRGLKIA